MAYNNFAEDLMTGLGQFSQGYMQGQREREDRAMRQQQFDQRQKMAGLNYDIAKQQFDYKRQQQEAMNQYANAARATLMGDYGLAKELHNQLGGAEVSEITPIDDKNIQFTYSDGRKHAIPRADYAQVLSAANDPARMEQAINHIATNEYRTEALQSRNVLAENKMKAMADENEKKRQSMEMQKEKDRISREKMTQWRVSASLNKAARGSGKSGGGVKEWALNQAATYWEGKGLGKDEARARATEQILISPSSPQKEKQLALSGYKTMATEGNSEQRKVALAKIEEISGGGGGNQQSGGMPRQQQQAPVKGSKSLPPGFKIVK